MDRASQPIARRTGALLDPIGAERDRHDLALAALFLDAQRLLDRELVVGRDDPRDARGVDGLPSAAIFTWVAVSGTCLMVTRIFMNVAPRSGVAGDRKPVAGK